MKNEQEAALTVSYPVQKFMNGAVHDALESVAREVPLTVSINGVEFATLVCTPSDRRELVIGFLASEGIIRKAAEIADLTFNDSQGYAYVQLTRDVSGQLEKSNRRFIGSCCGKSRQFYFQSDAETARTVLTITKISVQQCFQLMNDLSDQSQTFKETGGVHNAAFCHPNRIIAVRTDIGRHNALDKLYGFILAHRVSIKEGVIAFSGRISSEVVLKVAKMGIGLLLSKSAPTDLALKLASDLNITVIGFIRGERLNIYTHPERLTGGFVDQ
ncbi:formate dehydrogenase accessory sulfurtransferase FdhD [Camelliibacillus cellulosilyticus]|uniref:Sulfur carrier protein FdhD n=1 Tax=Camelliibacillus cellulosilyticus TaxID=2174486 RepID=A0ABV9GPK0_9BACL